MINNERALANAELQRRPLKDRDTRNFQGIPGPEMGPSGPRLPGGPDVGGGWTPRVSGPAENVSLIPDKRGTSVLDLAYSGSADKPLRSDEALRHARVRASEAAAKTPNGEQAMIKYAHVGPVDINSPLRAGTAAWYPDDVNAMTNLIDQTRPLSRPIEVYRGVKESSWLPANLTGQTLIDQGFLSTTTNPQIAQVFAGKGPSRVWFQIVVPDGVPVGIADKIEDEILLNRGTALLIESDTVESSWWGLTDVRVIKARVVGSYREAKTV